MKTATIEIIKKTTCPYCGRLEEFEEIDDLKDGHEVLCHRCLEWYIAINAQGVSHVCSD